MLNISLPNFHYPLFHSNSDTKLFLNFLGNSNDNPFVIDPKVKDIVSVEYAYAEIMHNFLYKN